MIERQYRQGDVLLTPAKIPAEAIPSKDCERVVLAEGEATGHAHTINFTREQMDVLLRDKEMYLRVRFPIVLRHQEHAKVKVDPGEYLVVRQVEVWLDEVRQVAD